MVSALEWVAIGMVVYAVAVMLLRARGYLPDYVKGGGPIITLHTKRGKQVLGKLARPKRFWRAWGNLGIGIALVVMVATLLMVATSAYLSVTRPPVAPSLYEPRNVLVIPGVNDFLPLSVAPELVTGLALALIIHEAGHGLFCRVGDIDIDSMGLVFLSFVPMGAFVGPDEESVSTADRGAQTRMFAAGVTNNFALGFVAVLLLFGPVVGSIAVVDGAPVGDALPGGPAAEAGIDSGAVITSVDGQAVTDPGELREALDAAGPTVEVGLKDGSETVIERRVLVRAVAPEGPLESGDTITAVNGTAVSTMGQFEDAVQGKTVARLSRANASDQTVVLGARVIVADGGPFADAGAPPGETVVVTQVDGERTHTGNNLREILQNAAPGDEIEIIARVGGEVEQFTVELGQGGEEDDAQLGVGIYNGINGITVTDLGVELYPAQSFLDAIGAGAFGSIQAFLTAIASLLAMPFGAIIPGMSTYNFAGFTGVAANFYTVEGPLAALGTGGGFFVANVLFWTAWVNFIVGQFNLVPAYPLDGGHIVRTITEAVVARTPIENGRTVTTYVTVGFSLAVLGAMALIFLGPRLFA